MFCAGAAQRRRREVRGSEARRGGAVHVHMKLLYIVISDTFLNLRMSITVKMVCVLRNEEAHKIDPR